MSQNVSGFLPPPMLHPSTTVGDDRLGRTDRHVLNVGTEISVESIEHYLKSCDAVEDSD